MKRILFGLLALCALALAPPAMAAITPQSGTILWAQAPDGSYHQVQVDINGNLGNTATPLGYVQVTVSSSAVGITPPAGATWCVFAVETNAIRWRDDGTNPTAAVGFPQGAGDRWVYPGSLSAIKFIRQSADATLNGVCYK